MNMSYCRFQNTALALQDCVSAMEERAQGEGASLSPDERKAAKNLAGLCVGLLVELNGTVDDFPADGDTLEWPTDDEAEDAMDKFWEGFDSP